MKTLAILCVLARTAAAESILVDPDQPDPPSHTTLLGFRISGGLQPVDDRDLQTMSLGLAIEHRVHGDWRVSGEYEYVWLGVRDTEAQGQNITDGAGHRTQIVVRHHLLRTRKLADTLRLFADVELGGGFMLASEPDTGTIAMPHALAGLRIGYDFIRLRRDTRASPVWEPELLVRAIATPGHAVGYTFGVGMNWGD